MEDKYYTDLVELRIERAEELIIEAKRLLENVVAGLGFKDFLREIGFLDRDPWQLHGRR